MLRSQPFTIRGGSQGSWRKDRPDCSPNPGAAYSSLISSPAFLHTHSVFMHAAMWAKQIALVVLQIWFSHRRRKDKTAAQAAQAAAAAPSSGMAPSYGGTPAASNATPKPMAASTPAPVPGQQPAQTPLGQQLAAVQQARLARTSPSAQFTSPAPLAGTSGLQQPDAAARPLGQPAHGAASEPPSRAASQQLPPFIAQVPFWHFGRPSLPMISLVIELDPCALVCVHSDMSCLTPTAKSCRDC